MHLTSQKRKLFLAVGCFIVQFISSPQNMGNYVY